MNNFTHNNKLKRMMNTPDPVAINDINKANELLEDYDVADLFGGANGLVPYDGVDLIGGANEPVPYDGVDLIGGANQLLQDEDEDDADDDADLIGDIF